MPQRINCLVGLISLLMLLPSSIAAVQEEFVAGPLTADRLAKAVAAAGFRIKSIKVDIPAAVRSEIPFVTLDYEDKLLQALREKYQLQKLIAPARDEWTAQLMLKEWVHKAIPGGNPKVTAEHAQDILEYASRGETFYCTHYAITYVECALALGWQARKIGVDRKHGPEGLGSTHHGVAEVWSNQFRKWVVIDPQSNLHFEKAGMPLSAWEIRAECVNDRGSTVDHMVGVPPYLTKKNPAIVWWDREGEDETATYFWMYLEDHAVRTNSSETVRLILPEDEANLSLIWYQNDYSSKRSQIHVGYLQNLFLPTLRIENLYWSIGVVEASLTGVSHGTIQFSLTSFCPNFVGFEVSLDGTHWERPKHEKSVLWPLKSGWNSLRTHTLSSGGVTGPEMSLLMLLD